jgi:hypothetical protein
MKPYAFLLLMLVPGLFACSDALAPEDARYQLVDATVRFDGTQEDAVFAYATFAISTEGGVVTRTPGTPGIAGDGNAVGTCGVGGRWTNPQGREAGPFLHPLCVTVGESSIIRLEVINAIQYEHNRNVTRVSFATDESLLVNYNSSSDNTTGEGVMQAIALKDGVPFGKFVIKLDQYNAQDTNLLNGNCYIGEAESEADQIADTNNWRSCLDRSINADFFADVNADITGTPDHTVSGYILWGTSKTEM